MIYFTVDSPYIVFRELSSDYAIKSGGKIYSIEDNEYANWQGPELLFSENKFCSIDGVKYRIHFSANYFDFRTVNKNSVFLVDDDGKKCDLSLEVAYLLANATSDRRYEDLVIGIVTRYNNNRRQSLMIGDMKTGQFKVRESFGLQQMLLLSDGVVGYHLSTESLIKVDHSLGDVWSFKPGSQCKGPMKAIAHSSLLVYYAGESRTEIVKEVPKQETIYGKEYMLPVGVALDGELYGIDRTTGEERWCNKFSYGLVDMVLHEGSLYCAAENEFFRIKPETGEIEHSVKLEYNAGGQTGREKVLNVIKDKLWVTINYITDKQFCLLVLNLNTFDIEHKIDLPAPCVADEFLYFDEDKSQVYYRLRHRQGDYRLWNDKQLLVLDLDDLGKPVTFEPRPDINIELKPAPDNADLEELWIHIKDTPLHKAIRFGLIETQNQASIYAETNMFNRGCHKTFNGRVHFRYSGSEKPAAEVREKLKIIEEEFAHVAKDMEAGDGSGRPVSIDVEYIE